MSNQHTALLALPELFAELGGNGIVLEGWDTAQGSYFWTDPDTGAQSYDGEPSCYQVHHTAGTKSVPVVRDSGGNWSKANAWGGLYRDGKLYQTGGGVPTIVFTSAGPARTSSGYGYWPMFTDYVLKDKRAPWKAEGSDTGQALNRYAFNLEVTHPGDYSELDDGVWEQVCILGQALHILFGWTERTVGHQSWTLRKIDPRWDGTDDCIIQVQDEIQRLLTEPETEEEDMTWADIVADSTWATAYELDYIQGDPALMPDYYFADGPANEDEKKNAYNVIMRNQMRIAKGLPRENA